jgi:hypothetical protein
MPFLDSTKQLRAQDSNYRLPMQLTLTDAKARRHHRYRRIDPASSVLEGPELATAGTYVALFTKSSNADKRTRYEAQRLSTVLSKAKRTQKSEVEVAKDEVETNVMGLENYHPLGDQGQLDEAAEMQKEVYNLQTISVNGRASILPTRIRTIHHPFRQAVLALVLQSLLQSEAQYNRTASPAQSNTNSPAYCVQMPHQPILTAVAYLPLFKTG